MTLPEAKAELEKFVKLKTTLRPAFVDVLLDACKWIPVTEALPEDDEMKFVTAQPKNGAANVNRAYFDGQFWHGSGSMSNVVAWMPLPEPYREGEQNE